jgi:hypothetical protein
MPCPGFRTHLPARRISDPEQSRSIIPSQAARRASPALRRIPDARLAAPPTTHPQQREQPSRNPRRPEPPLRLAATSHLTTHLRPAHPEISVAESLDSSTFAEPSPTTAQHARGVHAQRPERPGNAHND